MSHPHQLLILYRHAPAKADELRWCLRSLANVTGCNPVPLVVGDPPDWYTGPRLFVPAGGRRRPDVRRKLRAIIESDLVADDFVLFADDNAVVRPIDFLDLSIPRSSPPRTTPGEDWQRQRFATTEFARSRGWPVIDVSTHWPYCWRKQLLAVTLDLMDSIAANLLIESVYASMHNQPTRDARIDFRYCRRPGICEDARVISYGDPAFQSGLRDELQQLLPEASPWETGPVPNIRSIGVISPGQMHACAELGPFLRLDGTRTVHACRRFTECGPFGHPTHDCRSCDHYRPLPGRIISIGRQPPRRRQPARQCRPTTCQQLVDDRSP